METHEIVLENGEVVGNLTLEGAATLVADLYIEAESNTESWRIIREKDKWWWFEIRFRKEGGEAFWSLQLLEPDLDSLFKLIIQEYKPLFLGKK